MNAQQLTLLALQVSIVLTVFGFGLQATVSDILYVVRRPSLLGRSLVAMFLIMPIIAVAMASLFELRPSVEIVLIALSISPIPPLLPSRQGKAGGRTSYGVGLMALAGVLSIAIVPLGVQILGWYLGRPFAMSPGAIARIVLVAAVLPLGAGMAVRATLPAVADAIQKPAALLANVLLGGGILAILAAVFPAALALIGNGTLLALSAFVAAGLAVGHWLAGPNTDEQIVLALSTACRHPAIALAVATANFPNEPNLLATIFLALLVGLVVGVPYLRWQQRRARLFTSGA
jgi:BASS family bile acid:Na+ symporter